MKIKKGELAAAVGPYIRANGKQVDLAYLETVQVIVEANKDGEVYVVGLDSHNKTWILESSLAAWKPAPTIT